jgi:hypothetical protein
MAEETPCGCGGGALMAFLGDQDRARQRFVTGVVETGERKIPAVSPRLSRRDLIGGRRVRWLIGRKRYAVSPGLYAIGRPSSESPVLVTANYKLTFDRLRRELSGIDAWILALDTKGINVWCAAGKGTFGTKELTHRIVSERLEGIVSHRTLILPQLGATGVSAPLVKKATGFRVLFGPVRARDIPAYLSNGRKKTDGMRRVEFRLSDRMAIAPAELVQAWPIILAVLGAAALIGLPLDAGYFGRFFGGALPLLGAILVGTLLFPALLPLIPFRAFSLKGALLGVLWAALSALIFHASITGAAALIFVITPTTAFIAMNFTGSSTFTCQPGAAWEVRIGTIPMIASAVLGIGLFIATRILAR